MSDSQFENERQELIEKLQNQEQYLQKILKLNQSLNLIDKQACDNLSRLSANNQKYLHKLQTNEFEIAIVGLEKAGKSTFANALIENNILPSAPERCTFTATRLVSGSDQATVQFYTEDEFQDTFRKLLEEINYPNAQKVSFRKLGLQEFEKYFNKLEEKDNNLYKNHVGKTDEEIKDILKNRGDLILTGETKYFAGDELDKEVFQAYIKGENNGSNTAKPRSVKKIEIESSKLKELPNAVIYDVPGFDSPTTLHKTQTEKRLKHADAILLVTNVGRNPSIQGTSLSIITKSTDDDGIKLADKLFVFGNQLDTANSLEQADKNTQILINDVEKYKIGEAKRVFTGSALKYLADKNLAKDNYQANFDISSSIDEIRNALINYYENERFEILKRKIDKNYKHLLGVFESVLNDPKNEINENFSESGQRNRILLDAQKRISKSLKANLETLKYELKNEIINDLFFSKKFEESIKKSDYFSAISEEDWEKAKISSDDSVTLDEPVERINQYIRAQLHAKFLQDFSRLVKSLTDEKAKDIEIRILNSFTQALFNQSDVLENDTEIDIKKLLEKMTDDIAHDESRFEYLIERFSRNIFDILISYPLASQDRTNKFNQAKQEFMYLDGFYKEANGSLISLIISQGESNIPKEDIEGLGGLILGTIDEYRELIVDISSFIVKISSFNNGTNFLNITQHLFKDRQYDNLDKLIAISNSLDFKSLVLSPKTMANFDGVLSSVKRSSNKEEAIKEINKDIDILKSVLQSAVIPAINLEIAFFNGVDKQIKRLISATDDDSIYADIFTEFLSNAIEVIERKSLSDIESHIDHYKAKKELIAMLKQFN